MFTSDLINNHSAVAYSEVVSTSTEMHWSIIDIVSILSKGVKRAVILERRTSRGSIGIENFLVDEIVTIVL